MSTSGGTRSSSNATRVPSVGGGRSKAPLTHEEQVARNCERWAEMERKIDHGAGWFVQQR
jgi:hypothetical protein